MPLDRGASDENKLLSRSLQDDREAFGRLVERYAPAILNLAYRMVGERADAQDLAQETFLAAFKALHTFRADARFSTWLYRIAVNKCKDWLRTHRVAQELADSGAGEERVDEAVEYGTPEHVLSQKEVADHLERAIHMLPALYREAFVLKHVEGLSYEEMSEILGVNRDTLKMRVYKARRQLCQDLGRIKAAGDKEA